MTDKKRYFLELAYKGTGYHGWQIQGNAVSVQEVAQNSISVLLRNSTPIMGSGRTDTGVHGRQQFIHFDADEIEEKDTFLKKLNGMLPQDIAAYEIREVQPDAHARFSARWRSYEYRISLQKNPFEQDLSWFCYYKLDMERMNEAANLLLHYTDFECFSRVKTEVNHFECKIKEAYWEQIGQHLIFHITANRFLRGMVRTIVGTLVLVGREKLDLEGFRAIIHSKKRSKAGSSAPAQGLFLTKVVYPESIFI
ncbi:tRNA pseudouridine(38-40) synthase TruA [Lunatibacter salilacus]|uniref:tRNA pseudouridine(38-40) synthase TruA n=1 Tax=Lunatibacter salilacus TaxID=2483804 RepID=UPI00131A72EC|nr:tRNA pseudouridine(38-40) synthase TruA [Lunatibacter salilacus]